MRFEDFLAGWLAGLVRFSVVLCGRRVTGERLVEAAVARVFPERGNVADPDAASAEVRAWIVRGYLSEKMTLGRGPAADVDTPVAHVSEAVADGDDLATRFAASSKLQRATTVLYYGERLEVAEVAAAVGSTPDGIERYLRQVWINLNVRTERGEGTDAPNAHTEADVRTLLDDYGDDVHPWLAPLTDRLLAAIPGAADNAADTAAQTAAATPPRGMRFHFVPPAAPAPASRDEPRRAARRPQLDESPDPRPPGRSRSGGGLPPQARFKPSLTDRAASPRDPVEEDPPTEPAADPPDQRPRTPRRLAVVAAVVLVLVVAALGVTALLGRSSHAMRTASRHAPAPVVRTSSAHPTPTAPPSQLSSPTATPTPSPDSAPATHPSASPRRTPAEPNRATVTPEPRTLVADLRGTGPATIHLPAPGPHSRPTNVRIVLSCRGAPVWLHSSVRGLGGEYAEHCGGQPSYVFDRTAVRLPATLSIAAQQRTWWHIAVARA